jgi:hypothetical protein
VVTSNWAARNYQELIDFTRKRRALILAGSGDQELQQRGRHVLGPVSPSSAMDLVPCMAFMCSIVWGTVRPFYRPRRGMKIRILRRRRAQAPHGLAEIAQPAAAGGEGEEAARRQPRDRLLGAPRTSSRGTIDSILLMPRPYRLATSNVSVRQPGDH